MLKKSSGLIYSLNQNSCRRVLAAVGALAVLMFGLLPSAEAQAPTATGALIETGSSDGFSSFAMTLDNTSATDDIETFWFAWTPAGDYLDTDPVSVQTPAGWTDTITHTNSRDGYAIKFTTSISADALAPGDSLSGFGFSTADSESQLEMDSSFYSILDTTSEVMPMPDGGGGDSNPFVVAVIPEPASVALMAGGFCVCLWRARRRA
jgi:hypothetical protein